MHDVLMTQAADKITELQDEVARLKRENSLLANDLDAPRENGYCRKLPTLRQIINVVGTGRPNLPFGDCESIARDVLRELQSE